MFKFIGNYFAKQKEEAVADTRRFGLIAMMLYYYFAMYYVAKMIMMWAIWFEPNLANYVNTAILGLTFVLTIVINIRKFEVFYDFANTKGGFNYNLMIFSWVMLSGLATIYGQTEYFIKHYLA